MDSDLLKSKVTGGSGRGARDVKLSRCLKLASYLNLQASNIILLDEPKFMAQFFQFHVDEF